MADDILVDCSDLDDFELEDFRRFAEADPAIDTLTLSMVEWNSDPDAPIEIHAAAEPLLLVVHFAAQHTEGILSAGGTLALSVAKPYISALIKRWSDARANRYEERELYGPDGKVVKIVKSRRPGR